MRGCDDETGYRVLWFQRLVAREPIYNVEIGKYGNVKIGSYTILNSLTTI
jgi:hypothetical protein